PLAEPHEGGTGEHVELRVYEQAVEQTELSAKRYCGELRRQDPVERRDLVPEVAPQVHARELAVDEAGIALDRSRVSAALTASVHPLDVTREVRIDVRAKERGADSAPDAHRQPVEDAVVGAKPEDDLPSVLVEEREADVRGQLDAALPIEAHVTYGGRASQGTGEL